MNLRNLLMLLVTSVCLLNISCEEANEVCLVGGLDAETLVYRVQIIATGTFLDKDADTFFDPITDRSTIFYDPLISATDTVHRYLVGDFTTLAAAQTKETELDMVYAGEMPFVVVYGSAAGIQERIGEVTTAIEDQINACN